MILLILIIMAISSAYLVTGVAGAALSGWLWFGILIFLRFKPKKERET